MARPIRPVGCWTRPRWCFVSLNISLSHSSSLKVIQTGTIRKRGCDFLFAFHSNYGSICISSEIKPDIGHKSWFFHTPLHSALSLRWSLSEYCHPVWCGITRMVGLPDGEKNFEDMYNRLHTIPACDGRADRQTSCDCIVRAMHTRRAVKTVLKIGSLLYFIYFSILLLT